MANVWWLLLGQWSDCSWIQKPIFCPSKTLQTPPTQHQSSESQSWMAATTMASVRMHALLQYPFFFFLLPLISHPPLHFSKLRRNFVSLRWDHPSALPVDCHLVSYSCRHSGSLVPQWMTIQGHICTTFLGIYVLTALRHVDVKPEVSTLAKKKKKKSIHCSYEIRQLQLEDAITDRHSPL